jgi:hypothetical protein
MKNTSFYKDLIHAIEKLYSRITLRILHKRMNAYHQQLSLDNFKEHTVDIKAPLFKYIDDINSNDQQIVTGIQTLDYSFYLQITNRHIPSHYQFANQRVVNKKNVSELSKYFKARHNGSELHLGIDEKLKHSTWEHIHAAIRHARLGDARVAKMHADIANHAYRELAHYVSNEVHTEFTVEIENQLGVLSNNN